MSILWKCLEQSNQTRFIEKKIGIEWLWRQGDWINQVTVGWLDGNKNNKTRIYSIVNKHIFIIKLFYNDINKGMNMLNLCYFRLYPSQTYLLHISHLTASVEELRELFYWEFSCHFLYRYTVHSPQVYSILIWLLLDM